MPRPKERSFLDRALEALKERYPGERPTQTKLARIAGVSQPAVHEWGQPGRAPEHESVLKLGLALNVCIEWLYTERGPKHPQSLQPDADALLQALDKLDEKTKLEVARFAEFLKGSQTPQ